MGRVCRLLIGLLLVSVASPAMAQDFAGARLMALSESQRALASSNDAIFVNPAGMALGSTYSIEINYQDDFESNLRRFNASIMDSKLSRLKAGISYVYTDRRLSLLEDDMDYRTSGHRLDLAFAYPVTPEFGMGLTGRYINFAESIGEMEVEGSGYDKFTFDAGFAYRSQSGLGLGLAAYNLTNSRNPNVPITWGAGVGYQGEAFSAEVDIRYNAQIGAARYSAGASYVLAQVVPIRLGGLYDLKEERAEISAGVGYQDKSFGADLGFRQRLSIRDDLKETTEERLLGIAVRLSIDP